MKKLKFLFVMLIGILLIPSTVFAADEEGNDPVNVYFFHGDGCPHCAEAEEFFNSIEDEYGDMFDVVSYEVWYNETNAELMQQVAELRDEDASGVPYIIIGNQSWSGYADTYDDEIISKIESEYETSTDERYDIMNYVDGIDTNTDTSANSYAGDIAVVIAIVLVVAAVGGGIWFARKKAA